MSTLTKELKVKITADANGLKGALNSISSDISKVSKDFEGLKKVGEGVSNIGKKLTMGLTLPIVGVAGASAKLSIDFEKSFAKVSTLLDSSSTDFDKYKKDIKNASKEMGVSIDEYSEAVYQSISAGVDQAKAVEFTTQAVKLAKGGFTETATAVDLMTTIMNSYGDKAGDVNSIMDSLINTQNKGKTTVNELASSMGKIIPIANGLNVPFNTLNGAMASLTAGGIATAEATTYLKSMLNELGKGGTKVAGILKEETGKSFSELMNEGMPLSEVLGILQSNAEANGLAFNDLFGSSEAATAALALMRDGGADLDQKIKEITETTGSANEAFEKMEDTAGAKLEKAFNAMKISLIDVGDALAPLIEKFAEFVSKVADWISKFGELNPVTQNFILIVAGLLALLGPLLILIGSGISLFANLSIVAGALGVSVGALVGAFASVVGIVAGVVSAIAGFIAIVVNAYKTNETFRKNVDTVFNNIKSIISNVMSAIGSIISTTMSLISVIWNNGLKQILNLVLNILSSILSTFTSRLNSISNIVKTSISLITSIFRGDFKSVENIVNNVLNNVVNKFNSGMEKAKSAISKGINAMKNMFNITFPTPKIKLPHISISGSFSLNPPRVPKFGISWYSKGAIFKRPTVLGGMGVGRVLPTLNRAKSKKATFVANVIISIKMWYNIGRDRFRLAT